MHVRSTRRSILGSNTVRRGKRSGQSQRSSRIEESKLEERKPNHGYKPIADYGIIGDLRTVALVGIDGSIDFICFPCFDSPSIFAALLDNRKGGSFKLAPILDGAHHKQLYLPESNILLSRFLSSDGVAEISDFMPIAEDGTRLVRRAKATRGEMRFRMIFDPRFDYGRTGHRIEKKQRQAIFISRGEDET